MLFHLITDKREAFTVHRRCCVKRSSGTREEKPFVVELIHCHTHVPEKLSFRWDISLLPLPLLLEIYWGRTTYLCFCKFMVKNRGRLFPPPPINWDIFIIKLVVSWHNWIAKEGYKGHWLSIQSTRDQSSCFTMKEFFLIYLKMRQEKCLRKVKMGKNNNTWDRFVAKKRCRKRRFPPLYFEMLLYKMQSDFFLSCK